MFILFFYLLHEKPCNLDVANNPLLLLLYEKNSDQRNNGGILCFENIGSPGLHTEQKTKTKTKTKLKIRQSIKVNVEIVSKLSCSKRYTCQ